MPGVIGVWGLGFGVWAKDFSVTLTAKKPMSLVSAAVEIAPPESKAMLNLRGSP